MRRGTGCASYNGPVNYLIIDTSSRSTVLGLAQQGEILDRTSGEVKTHSREILPSIESLLEEAGLSMDQLDAIIYGQGPGSFTGLRIAVGVVQGLAYGLRIPSVPVSSLVAIAHAAALANGLSEANVFVSLFARLEEIYFGAYRLQQGQRPVDVVPESVKDVSDLPLLDEANWFAVGNTPDLWAKIESSTGVRFESVTDQVVPSVSSLLALGHQAYEAGQVQEATQVAPVYLREKVADKPGKRTGRT